MLADDDAVFREALQGLRRGDFSRLEPLFVNRAGAQPAIIEELLDAGAQVEEAGYPSGNASIDAVLRRHGAGVK